MSDETITSQESMPATVTAGGIPAEPIPVETLPDLIPVETLPDPVPADSVAMPPSATPRPATAVATTMPGAPPAPPPGATPAPPLGTETVAAAAAAATASAAAAAAAAPAIMVPKAGRAIVWGRRVARLTVAVALFGLGVAAGLRVFTVNQPVTAPIGDPTIAGQEAPNVVKELAIAIAADDAASIRAALVPETFSAYTAEMQQFGIASVRDVVTLGTYADGPQTATELIIQATTTDGNPFTINLIVLTQDGQIVRFR